MGTQCDPRDATVDKRSWHKQHAQNMSSFIGSNPFTATNFMSYERFSQLWNEILGERVTKFDASEGTIQALIEYGQGNKTKIEAIRASLGEQ